MAVEPIRDTPTLIDAEMAAAEELRDAGIEMAEEELGDENTKMGVEELNKDIEMTTVHGGEFDEDVEIGAGEVEEDVDNELDEHAVEIAAVAALVDGEDMEMAAKELVDDIHMDDGEENDQDIEMAVAELDKDVEIVDEIIDELNGEDVDMPDA